MKLIIQNRILKGQSTYIAFIDLEKAFDKTWVQGRFFNLRNRGIKGKIWRVMLRLKQNRKTTILTRFGKTKEIDIVYGMGQGPKYLIKLQQSDSIVMFKLRTRMTNLKNNFHGKYQDNNFPRCLHEPDDEELFFATRFIISKVQNYKLL